MKKMNTNINQIFQKLLKNLSVVGVSLSIFNTFNNLSTINKLRDNLEGEKDINAELTMQINNLINENESNVKLENIIRKSLEMQENNDNKIEVLNSKINKLIENKSFDENSISEVSNTMKDINTELVELFNKIDDCLRNSLIDLNIFSQLQTYMNNLNVFQTLALSHLFAIILIFILIVDLMSIYFSDYLISKINIKDKYPRIYKLIELRRKFKTFYLIKDIIIILIVLIALLYINILLFITFTL